VATKFVRHALGEFVTEQNLCITFKDTTTTSF